MNNHPTVAWVKNRIWHPTQFYHPPFTPFSKLLPTRHPQQSLSMPLQSLAGGHPSSFASMRITLAWWQGRAVQLTPERRRALSEPFDKSQDQLREFARRRIQRTAQDYPKGPCHGQHGFGSFCRNKRTSSFGGETPSDPEAYVFSWCYSYLIGFHPHPKTCPFILPSITTRDC